MIWRKKFSHHHMKNLDYLLASIIVMIVIGLFYRQPIFYAMIGIFTTYLLLNKLYDRFIGKKLELINERTTVRLFQGETESLTFVLQNQSLLPMLNGEFVLQTDPMIHSVENIESTVNNSNEFNLALSVMGKGKTKVEVPFQAEHRGVARVNHMTYIFPHLFNFDLVTLFYTPNYLTEVIVFPKPLQVQSIETAFQMTPGLQQINLSPFEDVQSPLGTREYHYSDSFHRINWKASLKAQQLQTNEYDKVIDMSYIFIVNIGTKQNFNMVQENESMEKLLSYTTYLCQYATKKGLPYEVFINARKPGKIPYIHLPTGEGKSHYSHLLEMLARIQKQSMTVSFHEMIHQVGQQMMTRKTIIFLGETTEESNQMIKHWQLRQHDVFYINTIDNVAIMKKWGMPDAK